MPKLNQIEYTATVRHRLTTNDGGTETVLVKAADVVDAHERLVKMGYKDVQVHDPMAAAPSTPAAATEQPVATQKMLDALPGLIGAIDHAIIDKTGEKFPFVLLVFGNGAALHATNIDAAVAMGAVQEFARQTQG